MKLRQPVTILQRKITQLHDLGLITSYEFLDHTKEKARLGLPNNQKIVVFMSDNFYMITYMGIREVWNRTPPPPDYIIYNKWDYDTSFGLEEAEAKGMQVIKYDKFCDLLKEIIKS